MTAGIVSGERKAACLSRTWVDSALPGNQVLASLRSASVSLPASIEARATKTNQKPMMTNLVLRPVIRLATDLVMLPPPGHSPYGSPPFGRNAPRGSWSHSTALAPPGAPPDPVDHEPRFLVGGVSRPLVHDQRGWAAGQRPMRLVVAVPKR